MLLPSAKLIVFLINYFLIIDYTISTMESEGRNPVKVIEVKLNNGQTIPAIGFGGAFGWPFDAAIVENAVRKAVDMGYRYFDCAYAYGTEQVIGRALNAKIEEGAVTREELFIVSKLWISDNEKEKVVPACIKSLSNMGLEYFDSYLIHYPFSDPGNVDYLDTWRGMEDCVSSGLTRSIGISNFNISQLQRLLDNAIIKPVINQVEVHVNMNQKEMRHFCASNNITVIAYSPFGAPSRSSSWQLPNNITVTIHAPEIQEIAKKYNKTNYQVNLRYLIDIGTIPIPRSSREKHLYENLNVFDFNLTAEEVECINTLNINLRTNLALPYKNHTNYPFWKTENLE